MLATILLRNGLMAFVGAQGIALLRVFDKLHKGLI
jgi:hypothetical protein